MVRASIAKFLVRCQKYRANNPDCEDEAGGCPKCGYVDDLVEDVIVSVKDAIDRRWADVREEAE